jgi:hypothetical protein
MPPVVGPAQGSRSGLITTVIISVTVAVIMIVVAVYYSTAASKAEKDLANLKTVDRGMYYDGAPSDAKVTRLQQMKEQFPGMNSALEISMAQSEQLAKLLGGNAAPDAAYQNAKSVIANASKRMAELKSQNLVNGDLSANASLSEAINSLMAQVGQLAQDKKNSDDQLVAANKAKADLIAAQKQQLDDKDKQIAEVNAKMAAMEQKVNELGQGYTTSLTSAQQTDTRTLKDLQDQVAKLTADLAQANKKNKDLDSQVTGLKGKLHLVRAKPEEAVVQQPDGMIIRNADNNRCFINIGSKQSVTLGLTFEVYDKGRGIPPLGDGLSDTNMPVGKASIEVVAVGPDTSECQITKLQPGQHVVVGDPIANLVFDPNTKYNFVVYGKFDLTGSGNDDSQIIKRLITQWGGKLQDHIDIDTDFVVMGAEPQLPAGLDPNNPQDQMRRLRYQQELAQYQAQVVAATQLSVPIMNQNRFLYFIGYYDQAKR